LTDAGIIGRDTILQALFSALAQLKRQPLPTGLFAERQTLLHSSYLYPVLSTAQQTANHLLVSMQHYPMEDVIFGDYRMELPDTALYQQVLGYFSSNNMRLMFIAPGVTTTHEARWYQTLYSVEPLSAELLRQLDNCQPDSAISLPAAN